MKRTWWVLLLLFAGALFGQDGDDDDGDIVDDSAPIESSDDPEPTSKPSGPSIDKKTPPRAKGKKPGWVERVSPDKAHRIKLPDDWVVSTRTGPDKRVVFDLDVRLPGSDAVAELFVVHANDMGDARRGPLLYRENAIKSVKGTSSEVGVRPRPWLLVSYEGRGRDARAFYTFKNLAGHGYYVRLRCPAADFAQARKDVRRAMDSLESDLPPHPPIPKQYEQERAGRFLLAVHPSATASLTPLKKLLKLQEKQFAKFHGRSPASKDRPLVIYVHASKAQAEKIYEPAAKSEGDFTIDTMNRRLFAVPVNRNDTDKAGLFVSEVQGLLYLEKYAGAEPLWAFVGERSVARAAYITTKPLPYLHAGMAAWGDGLIMEPLAEIPALQKTDYKTFANQAFFWVSMLHGTKRKKAYKAMLADLAEHYDPQRALSHFEGLDPQELKAEAQRFKDETIRRFQPKQK